MKRVRDLKTASYNGQRDGVMMGRESCQYVLWDNRQVTLHWRDEKDQECGAYVGDVYRNGNRTRIATEESPMSETGLSFLHDVRANSNTRTCFNPKNALGRN